MTFTTTDLCKLASLKHTPEQLLHELERKHPGLKFALCEFDVRSSCWRAVYGGALAQHAKQALPPNLRDRLLSWLLTPADEQRPLPEEHISPVVFDHVPHASAIRVGERYFVLLSNQHVSKDTAQELKHVMTSLLEHDLEIQALVHERNRAVADNQRLLQKFGREQLPNDIVGIDGGLSDVFKKVELVAPTDMPVLLLGETGSGKEVVARAVHETSARKDKPFIRVNCAAISPQLIDSELFGHERGSFTGASATRQGWFARANQGTLFLDEIGDMPTDVQVRLLRILQDGTYERVGGQKTEHTDVRLITATHCDLRDMVAAQQFRQDLWYRISTFPIDIPPLRARKEDIEPLADYLIERASKRFGLATPPLDRKSLSRLLEYDWPGNVREFAAVIDRAVILGQGRRLVLVDLSTGSIPPPKPSTPTSTPPESTQSQVSTPDASTSNASLASLDELQRSHITEALKRTHGRVSGVFGAAALLNINANTLRARMRKLGIDSGAFRASIYH